MVKINEIEKQIAEKNQLLDSLMNKKGNYSIEIEKESKELDRLLYLYYKSLRFANNCSVFLCTGV